MKVYLITGQQNVQVMFRKIDAVSSDKFGLLIMANLWGATKEDLVKFANDKSGRLQVVPEPSFDANGMQSNLKSQEQRRYWAGFHQVLRDYLARPNETDKLAESYQRLFTERLDRFTVGEWATISVVSFMRTHMAECAIISLVGPRILELNPGFCQLLWDFDEISLSLVWGLPRWMNRQAWEKRDRYRAACARYLEAAWAGFDPAGAEADSDWEPNFGSRFARELAKWMRESNFSLETSAGIVAITAIAG